MEEPHDDMSSLGRTNEALYHADMKPRRRVTLSPSGERLLPHAWGDGAEADASPASRQTRRLRSASLFLLGAVVFFILALGLAGYLFYFGGNTVSTEKVVVTAQGPTTIAAGDTVPLALTITNKNPTTIENAKVEIDFPDSTRDANNVLSPYPRYVENLGTIASGQTVTRSVKVVMFGGAGDTVSLPIAVSYGIAGSNSTFVKKSSYDLAISSTPLSVSIESPPETVAGELIAFKVTVRSNAAIPLANVVLNAAFPFGFTTTSSSAPLDTAGNIVLGTFAPGQSKQVTIIGPLSGQDGEQRVFHFTVGTVKSPKDDVLAVTYMTQDTSVMIAAPFITTKLAINNADSLTPLAPNTPQVASLSYRNTLSTAITNITVKVAISGSGIDYGSIKTTNGFYDSTTHTITFSSDSDSNLLSLPPNASGIDGFTFTTTPAGGVSPDISFAVSVSGVRAGESNTPEQVSVSSAVTTKVTTAVAFSAASSPVGGVIPPKPGQTTTYAIALNLRNEGSAIAGGSVTAILPSYVSYLNMTSGAGSFSFNPVSRTLTWNVGDVAQGGLATGIFQVAITPSTSQSGGSVILSGAASFSAYDRFAGVTVSAAADPVTTETVTDPDYKIGDGVVQ